VKRSIWVAAAAATALLLPAEASAGRLPPEGICLTPVAPDGVKPPPGRSANTATRTFRRR
jgi:hypothetical protein